MASFGIVLYPAKLNQGEYHEAHRQDIMVDGSCPKKFVSPSEPMLINTAYRSGGALVSILEVVQVVNGMYKKV